MGGESNPNKPHYDITMSRRTRRARTLFGEKVSALKVEDKQVDEENEEEKRKMKFIDIFGGKQEEGECKNSLGGHFTEEDKERQLVVKHEKGLDGVSLKKMVSRCAKMWGHMIKIKGGSRKKRVLQLTM
ncbi:hypothetical protein L1987_83593 [Smallanthus sonchifolius]|uniref:Uncharacterized protein n=1 Tax=Smallanthus sonchifolius TaxID=185202 RepID=A0ACB8YCK1_9ASTR|nr:hypothetical protein L1987_83593 [Smallanthus sonchifolius]